MNRSELQLRIDELADEFLQRRYDGENPSIEEFASANPDIATPLRQYLRTILMVDDIRDDTEFQSNPGFSPTSHNDEFPKLDDYEIIREIGRGGMGVVYEAQHISLDRTVALKVLPSGLFQNQGAVKRFELEAKSAARLHHTNIVPIFDVDQKDDVCYYAMQFIEGQSLDYVVNELGKMVGNSKNGKSSEQKDSVLSDTMKLGLSSTTAGRKPFYQNVARLGKQVSDAIHHAHENGIVHRDIKPANLMLDFNGNVWVTDFGLAKTDESNLTQTGDVVGTLRYMSPERFAGQVDRRGDIYSLGMTLYELLSQRPAFGNTDRLSLIDSIKTSDPKQLRKIDQNIPRDLETIVEKAIEKDPRRRYATAGEMAADLNRFILGQPIQARRVGNVERLWLWAKKRKALAAALSALSLLLIAGTAVSAIAAKYYRDLANQNLALAKSNEEKTNEADRRANEAEDAKSAAQTSEARTSATLQLVTDAFQAINPSSGSDAGILAREVLLQVEKKLNSSQLDDVGRLELLDTLTRSYIGIGEELTALSSAKQYYDLALKVLGEDEFQTVGARELLAQLYKISGRLDDAIPLFERNVECVKNHPDSEESTIIIAVGNLANSYYEAGRYDEALSLHEENVPRAKAALGEKHPIYISVFKSRALCYQNSGQFEKAIEQFRMALETNESENGEDHPDTLDSMNSLAVALSQNSENTEAIEVHRRAFELAKRKLGDTHPDTLNMMSNLVAAYNKSPDILPEAITLGEQALNLIREKFGEEHPYGVGALNSLASAYLRAGRYGDGIKTMQEQVQLAEAVYGAEHQNTIRAMGGLARALGKVERRKEALELREECLRRLTKSLGESNPDTLTTMNNLALTYVNIGETERAITMLKKVVKNRTKVYGDGHARVLSSMHVLGKAYQQGGQLDEAIEILESVHQARVSSLGNDHPSTVSVRVQLASAYMDDDRFEEGIPMMEEALDSSRKTKGDSHPTTLVVMHYLCGYLIKNQQYGEAEPLLIENLAMQKAKDPDAWMTHNVESLLGEALLRQGKTEEAKIALANAYKGLSSIQLPLGRERSLKTVIERLKALADETGDAEQADQWQSQLDGLGEDD